MHGFGSYLIHGLQRYFFFQAKAIQSSPIELDQQRLMQGKTAIPRVINLTELRQLYGIWAYRSGRVQKCTCADCSIERTWLRYLLKSFSIASAISLKAERIKGLIVLCTSSDCRFVRRMDMSWSQYCKIPCSNALQRSPRTPIAISQFCHSCDENKLSVCREVANLRIPYSLSQAACIINSSKRN